MKIQNNNQLYLAKQRKDKLQFELVSEGIGLKQHGILATWQDPVQKSKFVGMFAEYDDLVLQIAKYEGRRKK